MNLFLLASTGDPSIRTGPGLGFASRVLDGEPWAGLKLEPALDAQLRIPGATAYHHPREAGCGGAGVHRAGSPYSGALSARAARRRLRRGGLASS